MLVDMEQEGNNHTCFLHITNKETGQNEMVLRRCALNPVNRDSSQIDKITVSLMLSIVIGKLVTYRGKKYEVISVKDGKITLSGINGKNLDINVDEIRTFDFNIEIS